jgi:hypothetical protein
VAGLLLGAAGAGCSRCPRGQHCGDGSWRISLHGDPPAGWDAAVAPCVGSAAGVRLEGNGGPDRRMLVLSGKQWDRARVRTLEDCLSAVPGVDTVSEIAAY